MAAKAQAAADQAEAIVDQAEAIADQAEMVVEQAELTLVAQLIKLDEILSEGLHVNGWPLETGWRAVCKMLEYSGHGVPWFILALVLFLQGATVVALRLLYALVGDIVVLIVLKGSFRRQRPRYNVDDMLITVGVDSFSFPSGHASRCVMLAALAAELSVLPEYIGAVRLWAISVSLSRVMLGRHHVLDVMAGVGVGLGVAYTLVGWGLV